MRRGQARGSSGDVLTRVFPAPMKNGRRKCLRSAYWAILTMAAAVALVFPTSGRAQSCGQGLALNYFEPLTEGDGLRYPVTIGPLSWKLTGDAIQPVKGSDGLTHLAYSLFFANSWNYSATLKSIEVVDPMKGDAVTGKNQVLTSKNEDVTGQFRILSRPATLEKTNFATDLPSGQSAFMYFDVTYAEARTFRQC